MAGPTFVSGEFSLYQFVTDEATWTSTHTVTVPAGSTGDLLVAAVFCKGFQDVTTTNAITTNDLETWDRTAEGGGNSRSCFMWRFAGASEPASIDFTHHGPGNAEVAGVVLLRIDLGDQKPRWDGFTATHVGNQAGASPQTYNPGGTTAATSSFGGDTGVVLDFWEMRDSDSAVPSTGSPNDQYDFVYSTVPLGSQSKVTPGIQTGTEMYDSNPGVIPNYETIEYVVLPLYTGGVNITTTVAVEGLQAFAEVEDTGFLSVRDVDSLQLRLIRLSMQFTDVVATPIVGGLGSWHWG